MINGIYKATLNENGLIGARTRIKYECKECGKQLATTYGNYKGYKHKGLCIKCIWKAKK